MPLVTALGHGGAGRTWLPLSRPSLWRRGGHQEARLSPCPSRCLSWSRLMPGGIGQVADAALCTFGYANPTQNVRGAGRGWEMPVAVPCDGHEALRPRSAPATGPVPTPWCRAILTALQEHEATDRAAGHVGILLSSFIET